MSQNFPIDGINFTEFPSTTYLVGGWVRDSLLQRRKSHIDLDFVVQEGSIALAKSIAVRYNGGFVILDADREIARVVLPGITLDFAKQVGNCLEEDLSRRDFCMNAMAIDLDHPNRIIDPWGGKQDIDRRQIRMIAPENLYNDPLRILRAYRQAAQLQLTIEPWTRQTLRQLAGTLKYVAVERIRMELGYLLATPAGTPWLCNAFAEKILQDWLPSSALQIKRFQAVDEAIDLLCAHKPDLLAYFDRELISGHTIGMTIKYAALVGNASILDHLGLSRAEQRWISILLRYLPVFLELLVESPTPIGQCQLFHSTGETLPALLTIGLASQAHPPLVLPWLERWLDPHDPIAHPPTLVTGDDLQEILSIRPGPQIKDLLDKIRQAQACGIVTDRCTAIDYVQQLWSNY